MNDLLLLVPLAACFMLVARWNPALAEQIPAFLAFFAAFVVLPAVGLGGLLVRLPLSLAERLFLGGPVAFVTLFACAWSAAALRAPWLVWLQPALALGFCAVSILLARRANRADGGACPATPWPDLLLMLLVLSAGLALCLSKFAAVSAPVAGMAVDYYNDDTGSAAYVFAALRAVEHGLPVMQPLVAGAQLSYHLLLHYCYAACALVTGIHPLDMLLFLWPPALWLLLAGAVVIGCRRLAGFSMRETALATVLLIFSAGYGFNATHSVQLFAYQHTYFFGLPALLLFLCSLYGYLGGARPRLFAAHAGVCLFLAAATKPNLLVLVPVGLLPVLVVRIVRRQARWPEFALAAYSLVAAAVLKLTLLPNTERVALKLPKASKLFMGALGTLWDMALVVGPYILLAVLAAEASPVVRAKLERNRHYLVFAACFIVVSAVLLKALNFIGGDFYFYWQARLIVVLAFAPLAAHVFTWRVPRMRLAFALVLGLGVAATGHELFLSKPASGEPENPQAKIMAAGEREGLRWAAANLDRRKVFFTNKDTYMGSYLGGYIRHDLYDYLGFSGLQGYAWTTPFLPEPMLRTATKREAAQREFLRATTLDAAAQALARIDADYYMHCARLGEVMVPACLREVHGTDSLVIYENTCRQPR